MTRFNTLLLREWMQHHRGWLILMLSPPLLFLVLTPFGSVEFSPGELGPLPALEVMMIAMFATPGIVFAIAVAAVLFQTPGLARRDQQDRSIEFWLSLPASHSQSIGATVLMHVVGVPLLALLIGAAFGPFIGVALIAKVFGPAAALDLPWGTLAVAGGSALLRATLGLLLACLWVMPLVLGTMAASAWLKRWGVAVLAIVLSIGHKLLATFYDITLIGDTLGGLVENAKRAMVHDLPARTHGADAAVAWLVDAPALFFYDALGSLRDLAQPLFVFALLASAAAFGLLVLRRSRST